jgi:glycosyltransferase involved in cell wall biosynthesis
MKILHLLRSSRYSGAENVVSQIVKAFNDINGYEMVYCSPLGPIKDTLRDKSVPYIGLNSFSVSCIRAAIKEYKPDIIHAHGTSAGVLASLVCGKTPLILHIHNNSTNSRRLSVKSISNLLPFLKSQHVIWVSQDCLDCYLFSKYVRHKSSVVSNGIDLSDYSRSENIDKSKIIMVSRFSLAKDHATVIRSLPFIDPSYILYFVGEGETMDECKALVQSLNLENRVCFLGKRFDIPHLIRDAFIGIQSSHWEGFGMSALEIMASGVPLVASDANGLKQVVEGAGLIFERGNEYDLAQKVNELSTNSVLYEQVSAECRKRSKEYSMDRMVNNCKLIYSSIFKKV